MAGPSEAPSTAQLYNSRGQLPQQEAGRLSWGGAGLHLPPGAAWHLAGVHLSEISRRGIPPPGGAALVPGEQPGHQHTAEPRIGKGGRPQAGGSLLCSHTPHTPTPILTAAPPVMGQVVCLVTTPIPYSVHLAFSAGSTEPNTGAGCYYSDFFF